jgi:transcriptional regulator with XRE-family HTH domain
VAGSNGATYDLRQLRRDRGLSQRAVAVLAGLTSPEVSLLEHGKVTPRPATIVKLAKALGIDAYRMRDILAASAAAGRDGDAA